MLSGTRRIGTWSIGGRHHGDRRTSTDAPRDSWAFDTRTRRPTGAHLYLDDADAFARDADRAEEDLEHPWRRRQSSMCPFSVYYDI